ncbi:MAG TPA: hypothetical protein PLL36_05600 [Candidatus Hydrogenedentes bacterium]|nr:hypothetical protein [Candidatus Hydrogenedentota bacterium]
MRCHGRRAFTVDFMALIAYRGAAAAGYCRPAPPRGESRRGAVAGSGLFKAGGSIYAYIRAFTD